jgi:hypothetical protein
MIITRKERLKMSLVNERMNAILALSADVFGRQAELAIKNSSDMACIADIGTLTDIVVELRSERFARNQDDQVCLVLELGIRAESGGEIRATAADLCLIISAEARGTHRLTIDISLEYDELRLPPVQQEQEEQEQGEPDDQIQTMLQELDEVIQTMLQGWLPSLTVSIPLQAIFGSTMELEGEPELTIGGDFNGSLRTLAIGLEINVGTAVDRNHFRSVYDPPPTGARVSKDDFFVLVESEVMEIRMRQEALRALNLGEEIRGAK